MRRPRSGWPSLLQGLGRHTAPATRLAEPIPAGRACAAARRRAGRCGGRLCRSAEEARGRSGLEGDTATERLECALDRLPGGYHFAARIEAPRDRDAAARHRRTAPELREVPRSARGIAR